MIRTFFAYPAFVLGIAALTGCGGGGESSTIEGISTEAGEGTATNLFHAAELGDLAALQKFVSQGQALTNRHTDNQQTALHYAAWGGNTNVIAWLLEQKADINALDAEGQSPLDVAWMPRSESAEALLLASGAKPGKELRPPETKPASPVKAPEKESPVTEPSEAKP